MSRWSASRGSASTTIRASCHERVFEPHGHVLSAGAGADDRADAAFELLEVDVPEPGDVRAVREEVVDGDEERALAVVGEDRAEHLAEADRVLDQRQEELALLDRDALQSPEGGGEALQPGLDCREIQAERDADGRGRERVVDVVEARQAEGGL